MNVIGPVPPHAPAAPLRPAAPGGPSRPAPAAAAGSSPAPAAPAGGLWEILTPEEREFFERQASLGALTYRPHRAPAPAAEPAPLGQRLDVRA